MLLRFYGLSLAGLGVLLLAALTWRTIASAHRQAESIAPLSTRALLHEGRNSPLDAVCKDHT
jgi:hypothetical protein